MMCQRIGRSPISTIGLGRDAVSSDSRVPRPPARMTTFTSARPPGDSLWTSDLSVGQAADLFAAPMVPRAMGRRPSWNPQDLVVARGRDGNGVRDEGVRVLRVDVHVFDAVALQEGRYRRCRWACRRSWIDRSLGCRREPGVGDVLGYGRAEERAVHVGLE